MAEPGPELRKQPNSRDCFACGIENRNGLGLRFYEPGPDHVVCEITLPERFQGFPGLAHGGVMAAMLDEAAMRAAMTADHRRFMVTATMTIRYRRPVPVGEPLTLTGRLLKQRGRVSNAHAELLLPDGSVGAEAEATLVDAPKWAVDESRVEALGWRIYPD